MSETRNPSGLPEGRPRVPKNRLSRALDRNSSAATATEGFAVYVLGMLLVMSSVFVMIAGLALLVEGPGRGMGVGLMVGGAAGFAGGRWLMEEFGLQQAHRDSAPRPAASAGDRAASREQRAKVS